MHSFCQLITHTNMQQDATIDMLICLCLCVCALSGWSHRSNNSSNSSRRCATAGIREGGRLHGSGPKRWQGTARLFTFLCSPLLPCR